MENSKMKGGRLSVRDTFLKVNIVDESMRES